MGALHGGAAATILDNLTSITVATVASRSGWTNAGVSRSLNCTYLRPVVMGSVATVECRVLHVGRNLCELAGVIRNDDGEVAVVCAHGKAAVNYPPPPKM